ncbi:hypothetical protein LTR62_006662 [Meristemomyces frigidus]|uniref:PDZ GRASP-type domain-containing protein n=1 Tax=Meristemomyces frigidus TaxID=1508187 RepID=A0AAN7TVN8_9PEZI|nr:hypothetical protein LTR62_006662 [Meristemomyces frigidus]
MANLFGTLNRFISRLDSGEPLGSSLVSQTSSGTTSGHGFQVLRNTNTDLPLEPWFDFIIGVNNRTIDSPDPNLFATEIRNCAGSTISLGVYGTKGRAVREIYVPIPPAPGGKGLGVSLQWAALGSTQDVWHVLDVMPNSPADVAGLLPYGDYVLGSPDGSFTGSSGLNGLIDQLTDRSLRLFVYNHEYDVTRTVTITPSRNWGGEGALGCVLGYGALHRIPAPLTEPAQAPGETLFDSHGPEQHGYQPTINPSAPPESDLNPADFFVPADAPMSNAPPLALPLQTDTGTASPNGGPPPSGRPKKARAHHIAPVAGLDDYFAEGEAKSRELEGSRSATPKADGGLPPPPGKGPPPKAVSPAPAVESQESVA